MSDQIQAPKSAVSGGQLFLLGLILGLVCGALISAVITPRLNAPRIDVKGTPAKIPAQTRPDVPDELTPRPATSESESKAPAEPPPAMQPQPQPQPERKPDTTPATPR